MKPRHLPHLAARITGTPLLVHPNKLRVILSAVGQRVGLESAEDEAEFTPPEEREGRKQGSVAVLSIVGSLVTRGGYMDALSGVTSYAAIAGRLEELLADESVGGIVLDLDSFGGEAQGAFDLADKVLEARKVKPIVAAVNENAYSGGYLLASAADRVFVPRTGGVGSIGVVAVHVDQSGFDQERGLAYEFIFAGDKKVDGHGHAPLTDRARAGEQAEIDRLYTLFVEAVGSHGRLTVEQIKKTEAGTFHGERAVVAGLADEVGTLADAISHVEQRIKPTTESPFGRMPTFPRSQVA